MILVVLFFFFFWNPYNRKDFVFIHSLGFTPSLQYFFFVSGAVSSAHEVIRELLQTENGQSKLKTWFNFCEDTDLSDANVQRDWAGFGAIGIDAQGNDPSCDVIFFFFVQNVSHIVYTSRGGTADSIGVRADPRPRTIFLLIENLNFIRADPRPRSPLWYTSQLKLTTRIYTIITPLRLKICWFSQGGGQLLRIPEKVKNDNFSNKKSQEKNFFFRKNASKAVKNFCSEKWPKFF